MNMVIVSLKYDEMLEGLNLTIIDNIIKYAGEIKEKGKVATDLYGWQTCTSIAKIEIEHLLTVRLEDCTQYFINVHMNICG